MFYDTYGDEKNSVLVLLHGAAALDTFSHQYELLASRFFVLVPHLPGAGEAVTHPYDPQETTDALADWIVSLNFGKVMLMGHSLGGELAVKLVSEHESLFSRAVFLSPWVTSSEKSATLYSNMARLTHRSVKNAKLMRMQAKYWGYTPEQAEKLVSYSANIPLDTYVSFFQKRIHLSELSGYCSVQIPMLAMCARGEMAEMKTSVHALGEQNTNCLSVIFPKGSHDFVLRCSDLLNPLLMDFLTQS